MNVLTYNARSAKYRSVSKYASAYGRNKTWQLIERSVCYGIHQVRHEQRPNILNKYRIIKVKRSFITLNCIYSATIMDSSSSLNAMYPSLMKIDVLNKKDILIKDKEATEKLVNALLNEGLQNLQFIVDFDYTISRGHFEGERNDSSWGVLDNSEYVPKFYITESKKLFEKYYPIEIHARMTEEEKIPHICDWYSQIKDLLIKCNLQKDKISIMVKDSKIGLRDNTDKLFKTLDENEVPILIFSAGMGDILEEVLRVFNVYHKNVKVVSNFFKYNDQGIMVDFLGDQIHMFNKNENAIHSSDSDYFDTLKNRRNVILMGDSIGDTKMAVGVPEPNNVLKIGFLNEKVEDRIDIYMDAYDIVLIKNQTMNLPMAIVSNITTPLLTG